jgi:hypothetical protein
MRFDRAVGLLCLVGGIATASRATAMQFDQMPLSPAEVIVSGRGPIVKDDTLRLDQTLAAIDPGRQVLALTLDSPGGNVAEGEALARLIRLRKLTVVVPTSSKCVSACFLLLAASPRRLSAADALVGVHSASESGEETINALAVTTRMARDAAILGIPPAVIGKMVQTEPGRVEWLTQADLTSMNVAIFADDLPAALRQTTAASRTVSPAQPSSVTPEFAAGYEDRRVWDAWLSGLSGPYRDGAVFAQTQTGLTQTGTSRPGVCYDANGAGRGDFTAGCDAARQRLATAERRLRGNPAYAAGWNSQGQPQLANEPAEAEYQGAFFCGRQVARLTLKVFAQSDKTQRQALFSFGPQATSPEVPRGAFLVEGSISVDGGLMSLLPVRWVTQPASFNWLGLRGNSDDGGKTFEGRVIDNSACTVFTLKRVDDLAAAR